MAGRSTSSRRASGADRPGDWARPRLILAAALLAATIAVGLLQRAGLFSPADELAMKIVEHLQMVRGAGLATTLSLMLDRLGAGGGRIAIALLVALCFAQTGHPRNALWIILTVVGMALLNPVLKLAFAAPRPEVFERLVHVTTYSFPSGHAAGAASLYGAIALRLRHPLVLVFCAGMVLATGLSRVWLGVHWPSDVVGGWLAGFAWVAFMSAYRRPVVKRASLGDDASPGVSTSLDTNGGAAALD